jgi:hypothetical protein
MSEQRLDTRFESQKESGASSGNGDQCGGRIPWHEVREVREMKMN